MKHIILFLYHWSSKINVWSWQKLWGNRKSIIKNAKDLMERMENSPFDFIQHSQDQV